jgi:hypothetical protein
MKSLKSIFILPLLALFLGHSQPAHSGIIIGVLYTQSNDPSWPNKPVWGGVAGATTSLIIAAIPAGIGYMALDFGDAGTAKWSFIITGGVILLDEKAESTLDHKLRNHLAFFEDSETYELLTKKILSSENYLEIVNDQNNFIEVFLSKNEVDEIVQYEDITEQERLLVYELLTR